MSEETAGFNCPLCDRVGDPSKMVKDARWADLVHPECVSKLDRWDGRGKDPRGRSGDDTYYDYDDGEAA